MEAVPPKSYPREKGSPVYGLPLESEGPTDFFPSVCLKYHWDPTSILRWTLPEGYVAQQLDPRPWTRICMEYTTAGEEQAPQHTDPNIVMPPGGKFYPPDRYTAAIDDESKLRVLDRPLGTCEGNQWEPNIEGDMYNSRPLVPKGQSASDPSKIQELAYPRALLRSGPGPYECREENDKYNVSVSSDYLFNNATKQDRYKQMNKPTKPGPPEGSLKASPERMRPDLTFNAASTATSNPTTYEISYKNQRQAMLVAEVAPTRFDKVPTNPNPTDKKYGPYDTHFAPRG